MTTTKRVVVTTRDEGQCFATVGEVRDARTNRLLATTGVVPYGFDLAAYDRACAIAMERGWTVVEGD